MTVQNETVIQVLRKLIVEDGVDVNVAADKALSSVSRAKLAEFVHPVVAAEARRIARLAARRVEDAMFSHHPTIGVASPDHGPSGGGDPRMTTAEARRLIVASSFCTTDGVWVAWGTATAEEHLGRAGWQRRHAAACTTDAERHERAAALIDERGVSCLDEIDGWADLLGDPS